MPAERPRLVPKPALRIVDGFVIALTVATACSLFVAAQTGGASHSHELLPTLVITPAR